MSEVKHIDKAFMDRQRRRLVQIRRQVLGLQDDQTHEETDTNEEFSGQARTYEDDAQRLATLELEGQLTAANRQRLQNVDRALQKIKEGSYGLSDHSHAPIPRDRLEAIPEALLTLDEQAARDAR